MIRAIETTTTTAAVTSTTTRQEEDSTISTQLPESSSSCKMSDRPYTKHIVVLVHGVMGTHKELAYVKEALEREFKSALSSASSSSSSSIPTTTTDDDTMSDTLFDQFVVHAASSNDEKTLDGIEAGGRRLAMEINELLRNETTTIRRQHDDDNDNNGGRLPTTTPAMMTLSILGNSLGGLYGRYALPYIDWNLSTTTTVTVRPGVFITTATPHLGIRDMTLIPLPQSLQSMGASYLKETGHDLFQQQGSDVIHRLCLDPQFLTPLTKFSKRLAFANTYSTDGPVITSTAAFLAKSSPSLHILVKTKDNDDNDKADGAVNDGGSNGNGNGRLHAQAPYPTIRFETENTYREKEDEVLSEKKDPEKITDENHSIFVEEYSKSLDSLGWTKIFVDVRGHIPALWFRGQPRRDFEDIMMGMSATTKEETDDDNSNNNDDDDPKTPSYYYTSAELHRQFSTYDWNTLPFAHSFLVASSKNSMYQWFYSGGRPLVDRIAREIVHEILVPSEVGGASDC